MGRQTTSLALLLLAACASPPPPVQHMTPPDLPPATLDQVTILDPDRRIAGDTLAEARPGTTPGIVDVRRALAATPEARELRVRGYSEQAPEFHFLVHRANRRVLEAIRRVADRRSIGLVLETGSVVLKPDVSDAAVADITEEVALLVRR